ncbi:MAG: hypothetical protein LC631_03630, partial [Desulfovibrionales bacterium]|nr:hypothetical protein [Desulfovibrionales bacterium]
IGHLYYVQCSTFNVQGYKKRGSTFNVQGYKKRGSMFKVQCSTLKKEKFKREEMFNVQNLRFRI